MSGLLWGPEIHSWGKEDVWHHMNIEHRMGFSRRDGGLVSPKMGVAASYRCPSPDLKDATAAYGFKHPCRSHLLGSMCCTKTLASLFYGKRAETVSRPYPAHGSMACSKGSRSPLTQHGTVSSPPYSLTQMLRLKT